MIIGSPVAYEELTADIVINGKYVARINKEEGVGKMVVEFFESKLKEKIYLDEFINGLQEGRRLLLK